MKGLIAGTFAVAIAAASASALAAEDGKYEDGKYYVTVDTVGNCSVSDGKPSAGQKALGEADGYASKEDADKKLAEIRDDASVCKGVVE